MSKGIIDEIDKKLILALEDDARRSSIDIGKELNVSSATIRRRIKRLIENRSIRIVASVDPSQIGLPVVAWLALDVDHSKLKNVKNMLVKRKEIRWLTTTTGRYDMAAIARFKSGEHLLAFVQNELTAIDGIKDVETSVCLSVDKGRWHRPLTDYPKSE